MMPATEKINKKIEIPSDIRYIKKVSGEILGYLHRLKIDKSIQFDVRLAVEEAVRNSITHGHHYDKRLSVSVTYALDKDKIEIEIEDKGEGFDKKKLLDPTHNENLIKESGRGVFLIYKLMDKVEYNKKGNKIRITKFFR